jgi:hypothetical protein
VQRTHKNKVRLRGILTSSCSKLVNSQHHSILHHVLKPHTAARLNFTDHEFPTGRFHYSCKVWYRSQLTTSLVTSTVQQSSATRGYVVFQVLQLYRVFPTAIFDLMCHKLLICVRVGRIRGPHVEIDSCVFMSKMDLLIAVPIFQIRNLYDWQAIIVLYAAEEYVSCLSLQFDTRMLLCTSRMRKEYSCETQDEYYQLRAS